MIPGKRPIPLAPAPARFGGTNTHPTTAKAGPEPTMNDELSDTSSSEGETQLVARTDTTGMYAELENDEEEYEIEGEEHIGDDDVDRDELVRQRIANSQEQMKNILEELDEEQLQRYETFRRVGLPRPMIKKMIMRVLENLSVTNAAGSGGGSGASSGKDKVSSANLNPSTIIVVSGIAKVFVGELIEEARVVQEEWKALNQPDLPPSSMTTSLDEGPLTPVHVMEAYRRMKAKSLLPKSCNYRQRTMM